MTSYKTHRDNQCAASIGISKKEKDDIKIVAAVTASPTCTDRSGATHSAMDTVVITVVLMCIYVYILALILYDKRK